MLSLKQSITQMEAVVALGNKQTARQRGLVALLEMRGQGSATARRTLRTLEVRQRERLVELERLRVQLTLCDDPAIPHSSGA
jgi:hypothetical protein